MSFMRKWLRSSPVAGLPLTRSMDAITDTIASSANGHSTVYRSFPARLVYWTLEDQQNFLNVVTNDGKIYYKFEVSAAQMDRICREYLNARL